MVRSYLILNLTSWNHLPMMERWFFRDHAPYTIAQVAPILRRYVTYRAAPPPEQGLEYGYYNWRLTEQWWTEIPFRQELGYGSALAERLSSGHALAMGIAGGGVQEAPEWGTPSPVFIFVPSRPTDDFKGKGLTLEDGHNLRWVTIMRYPEGVSVGAGDDWYVNVHAKEVCQQPGLKRFFSFHAVEPSGLVGHWARVSELWYENHDAWRKSVIESPPKYTAPPWARYDKYPYLEPGVDFVSTFVLERPECDFLREYSGYIVTA